MARDLRRLAAIVSADVVGYSRLMGRDESGTLADLKGHRHELIDPKIAEYGGRIVKTTGDGLLVEFPSVVEAVRCAVDVQRLMVERNSNVPTENRIEFRIGINVGDIIIDNDDLFGDGVNVAARLQSLADPGGICVSRAVRDQVLDKLSFGFEDLGPQTVKNIARPIEAYRVVNDALEAGNARRAVTAHPQIRRWASRSWLVAAGLGVIILVLLWRWEPWTQKAQAPPAFSIGLMPFVAKNHQPGEDEMAAAFTSSLLTAISEAKAPISLVDAPGQQAGVLDTQAIGRKSNVRYLIQGEVRSNNDKMDVTVYLVDVDSRNYVFSEQLQVDRAITFKAIGEVVGQLKKRLGDSLYETENRRAIARPTPGSKSDLILHGWAGASAAIAAHDLAGQWETVRKDFDEALKIDPNYVPAMLVLATLLGVLCADDLDADAATRAHRIDEMDKLTERALRVDDAEWEAWYHRSSALSLRGRFEQALAANDRAIQIRKNREPGQSPLLAQQASILLNLDRPESALEAAERSAQLQHASNTGQEGFSYRLICFADQLLGRYRDAVEACEKSAAIDNWWLDHMMLTAAYSELGDAAKSGAAKNALLLQKPGFTIEKLKATVTANRYETYVFPGLRKAGIPEK